MTPLSTEREVIHIKVWRKGGPKYRNEVLPIFFAFQRTKLSFALNYLVHASAREELADRSRSPEASKREDRSELFSSFAVAKAINEEVFLDKSRSLV